MSVYLLDVNVLVALSWPTHISHSTTQRWFVRNAGKGWATCPIVQAGFVRILSNPAFSASAVTPAEAIEALKTTTQHPMHQFWPDDLRIPEALANFEGRIFGHQQLTDAYLLALAIHRKAKLATLDRRAGELIADRAKERQHLEMIG